MINSFTELNPLLMSILICVTYSLLMVTPISFIATAISLDGLGSGAANMGIVAACVTFIFGSWVNSAGVNIVLLIGAAKMIPVYLKHLIIMIPLAIVVVECLFDWYKRDTAFCRIWLYRISRANKCIKSYDWRCNYEYNLISVWLFYHTIC